MSTVYILGAGFSRTCGIATDAEMLSELDPLLKLHSIKPWGKTTAIRSIREQMFRREREVGFEKFMTTLSSLKFMGDYLDNSENIFRESEKEVKSALKRYLESKVKSVNWANEGKSILRFISRVDWNADYVITFNYDLLLESAARHLEVDVKERILHLHGTISGRAIAWPTYTKFAYRTTKTSLGPLWKKAFQILRCQVENQTPINKLIFIGYSMPNTDLEAMSLFSYADWYNDHDRFKYEILVVNPTAKVADNYAFLSRTPRFVRMTLEQWLDAHTTGLIAPAHGEKAE